MKAASENTNNGIYIYIYIGTLKINSWNKACGKFYCYRIKILTNHLKSSQIFFYKGLNKFNLKIVPISMDIKTTSRFHIQSSLNRESKFNIKASRCREQIFNFQSSHFPVRCRETIPEKRRKRVSVAHDSAPRILKLPHPANLVTDS